MSSGLTRIKVSCPAIDNKLRQRIISLLTGSKPLTVTDIYIKLRIEQSNASSNLAILRRAGVVITERQGKFMYYSLCYERLRYLQAEREYYENKIIDLESCVFVFDSQPDLIRSGCFKKSNGI